ncbi:unnamed protein product [Closterium sp. NIES-53]
MATITVVAVSRGGQQQPLPHSDTLSPQQIREWVIQRGHPGGGGYRAGGAGQQRQPAHPDTLSPQQIPEWIVQRDCPGGGGYGFMARLPWVCEAAALGASEAAAAPGASESAAALGASESAAALGASASAAALGASASTATGPASAEALHTFTLDSGASRCFFRDCTIVTLLAAPVPASLADPTGGPIVARASTALPCPAIPSSSLSGPHLPSFLTNLVAASGQVAASSQVSASGQLAASCSCHVLSHHTLLWHHQPGHPFLPRLRSMHSHLLVSGLPRSLPPLPCSPALPCLPCVEGRQRAAPHSSDFPPTTAPLQTLHMDVWGPSRVSGTDQERYFLLVVDEYSRYTTVFPLRNKVDVTGVLIPWISAARLHLRERFWRDLLVLRLHFDRGKRRISLAMEVAPHFLWPFAVRYAAHQLNLWPRVSLPETSPTLRWTGEVGDSPAFRVWGVLSHVCDTTANKLSPRTLCCAFLGFPTDAPPWQFYYPRSCRVFSSQDATFDESVYPLRPQGPAPSDVSQVDPPPLVEPLEISSNSSSPAEGGDTAADDTAAARHSPCLETPPGFPPRPSSPPPQPTAVDSGAATGGDIGGAGFGGAETGGAGSGGVENGGADTGGAASPSSSGAVGDPTRGPGVGQPSRLETLSPQQIRDWIVQRGRRGGGGYGVTASGAAYAGGTRRAAGARGTRGAGGAGGAA